MSDDQIIAIVEQIHIEQLCEVAVTALLVYEWAITLSQEVEFFWKAPLTGATILFALNRYIIALSYATAYIPSQSLSSCKVIAFLEYSFEISAYIPWAAFSAMRAYALSGRRWYIMTWVLLMSCIPIILNLIQVYWLYAVINPFAGCSTGTKMSDSLQTIFTIISRTSLILADTIAITTTWITMHDTIRIGNLQATPLFSRLFLVDGTIYFITLLVLNILDFILAILQIVNKEVGDSYSIIFYEVITPILVSRFLLDLQAVKRKTQHQSSLDSTSSSVIFERIMGSINSQLQPGDLQFLSGGDIEDMANEEDPSGSGNGDSEEVADPVLSIGGSSPEENALGINQTRTGRQA
ncbi:hypothetical protein C8Q80DRAFT_1212405 [Daedaleopsis nitida]|nr:hypothetical protein C8Q80DRAFT_1212405 [Daedaleopsis nitida]